MDISRRKFVKMAGLAVAGASFGSALAVDGAKAQAAKNIALKGQAPVVGSKELAGQADGSTAKVYFTRHIDAQHLISFYNRINDSIYGKVAIKLHTGEKNGPYILPREMVKAFQAQVPNSNIVETNTLYAGDRVTTAGHRETLKVNGWDFCPVDIMDEEGGVDLPVRNCLHLPYVTMGSHIVNYDSMIVLTHFKGHAMGGYGGSLKNIAIGCASGAVGKKQVHGYSGNGMPGNDDWGPDKMAQEDAFMENLADSGKATCDYFGKHIVFLNVLRSMSVDCDCMGTHAVPPVIPDIGILASTDILAIDQASCDLVYGRSETEKHDLVERIESRHGLHQLAAMRRLKMGNDQYELIDVD